VQKDKEQIIIFDTTLRDGEQSPGINLKESEKVEIAHQLARLGVDVIEAGFPVASEGDFAAVQRIAREVNGPIICALARANQDDIDKAWQAVADAASPRLHVFLATSDLHIDKKLQSNKKKVLEQIKRSVAQAVLLCDNVEFSPEDGSRTEIDFLAEVVQAALIEGAAVINIPDTVGYATPEGYARQLTELQKRVPALFDAQLSVHCHDDLGLAMANTWAGINAGARQVEGTINGIGERAGNASLEELAMLIRTHPEAGFKTNLILKELPSASRLISRLTGYPVPPNKAVVGANAFAHESGIHQDGVLKARETYEVIDPSELGLESNALFLGKHSGRHALRNTLDGMGYRVSGAQLKDVFVRFKELCDQKKQVSLADLEALMSDYTNEIQLFSLVSYQLTSGNLKTTEAEVKITSQDGEEIIGHGEGDGPVDALLSALGEATNREVKLLEYRVEAVTPDTDALGEVMVRALIDDHIIMGRAAGTDILEATARAYLRALAR
jgi:2-isopropylmalate synthase